jgi:two-component system chemotaxis response regulator CheB
MKKSFDYYRKGHLLKLDKDNSEKIILSESFAMILEKEKEKFWLFLGRSGLEQSIKSIDFSQFTEVQLIGGLELGKVSSDLKKELVGLKKFFANQDIPVRPIHFCVQDILEIDFQNPITIKQKKLSGPFLTLVDDSKTFLKLAKRELEEQIEGDYEILSSSNPMCALELSTHHQNKMIITDINMPYMEGDQLAAIAGHYRPVLLMSGEVEGDSEKVVNVLDQGVVDFVSKDKISTDLMRTKIEGLLTSKNVNLFECTSRKKSEPKHRYPIDLHVIGISTGGVQTLEYLFDRLKSVTCPIVIVIHMPGTYTEYFCDRLINKYKNLNFQYVDGATQISESKIYLLGGNQHYKITSAEERKKWKIKPYSQQKVQGYCPNIDFFFESLAEHNCKNISAGLLTGMGKDGAKGLRAIEQKQGFVFCQDEISSIVYGMPKAGVEFCPDSEVLDLEQIARWLSSRF